MQQTNLSKDKREIFTSFITGYRVGIVGVENHSTLGNKDCFCNLEDASLQSLASNDHSSKAAFMLARSIRTYTTFDKYIFYNRAVHSLTGALGQDLTFGYYHLGNPFT